MSIREDFMSTFLGSIHFWMYGKIQSQEELIYPKCRKTPNFSYGDIRRVR